MKILYIVRNTEHLRYSLDLLMDLLNRDDNFVYVIFTYPTDYAKQKIIINLGNRYLTRLRIINVPIIKSLSIKLFYRLANILDLLHYKTSELSGLSDINSRVRFHGRNYFYNKLIKFFIINKYFVKLKIKLFRYFIYLISNNTQLVKFFSEFNADIAIFSGLVYVDNLQPYYLNILKNLGVRTTYLVNSWDNLSNKGDIKVNPDIVYVWNEEIKLECIKLHYINEVSIKVVGSVAFQKLYGFSPNLKFDQLDKFNIPHNENYILYLGSSPNIIDAKIEKNILLSICNLLNDKKSTTKIIFRPHPNQHIVIDSAPSNLIGLSNEWMYENAHYNEYYNLLNHSLAVFSINSSSIIEAGFFGKNTYSIASKEIQCSQDGTYHYRYLKNLGLLKIFSNILEVVTNIEFYESNNENILSKNVNAFIFPKSRPTDVILMDIEASIKPVKRNKLNLIFSALLVNTLRIPIVLLYDIYINISQKSIIESVLKKKKNSKLNFDKNIESKFFNASFKLLNLNNSIKIENQLSKIAKLNKSDRILIGPWLGEIGFELLYWVPFVRFVMNELGIPKSKVIIISRGGNSSWYSDFAGKYFNIYDNFSAQEIANIQNSRVFELGHQKQSKLTESDTNLIKSFIPKINRKVGILHPSDMFTLFSPYLSGRLGVSYALSITQFKPMKFKRYGKAKDLPKDYICCKFYFRESFPDCVENREFIRKVIDYFSKKSHVINLTLNYKLDDHETYFQNSSNVIEIDETQVPYEENIQIQSSIISNSRLFIGTYGGFAYLANLANIPSVCFVSEHETKSTTRHVDFANQALADYGESTKIYTTQVFENIYLKTKSE
jgi:hypothetical protein